MEVFANYYLQGVKYIGRKRPWIAEINGVSDKFDFDREFLSPLTDYTNSNRPVTRGTELFFHLKEGKIYEIFEHVSWKNDNRKFVKNISGKLIELSKLDVKLELINNA